MMVVDEPPSGARLRQRRVEPPVLLAPRRQSLVAVDRKEVGVAVAILVVILRRRQREVTVVVSVVPLVIADARKDGHAPEQLAARPEQIVGPLPLVGAVID